MRLFARSCTARSIELEEAQEFIEDNHRQGALKKLGPTTQIGLFHQDQLVGVVQFGYPRTSEKAEKYCFELLRMAFLQDVRVVGGASKLIGHYRKNFNPSDFFTYQDTSGEATEVYSSSGMTLVSQTRKKQYLVAPGKTLETGSRREVLGMAYATRYGPDRILGTKIGESLREDGTRKSNRDIFLEDLGWHVEDTSGDRIYEWVNPNLTFYVYKTTASDSDKYYIGVSHLKKANGTKDDCLKADYYGSGSDKFKNWRKKHRAHLQKEVLGVFERKVDAYKFEAEQISDKWRDDGLCLNSRPGGMGKSPNPHKEKYPIQICEVHGLAKHQGGKCMRCISIDRIEYLYCEVHKKETAHLGQACMSCNTSTAFEILDCPVHGKTQFRKSLCVKCAVANSVTVEECPEHGSSKHHYGICTKCRASKNRSIEICAIHGEVAFHGGKCQTCQNLKRYSNKECEVHGMTKHQGDACAKCSQKDAVSIKTCPTHGAVTHQGQTCSRCTTEKVFSERECPKHGMSKFSGDSCRSCTIEKSVNLQECEVHGLTKHRGKTCSKCIGVKMAHNRFHKIAPVEDCKSCEEELISE